MNQKACSDSEKHLYRIKYAIYGNASFISHADQARALERAFRRADLPMVYSKGFHPKPQFSYGVARPTGFGSLSEITDFALKDNILPEEIKNSLEFHLPSGFRVLEVFGISDREYGSFQKKISAVLIALVFSGKGDFIREVAEKLLSETEATVIKDDMAAEEFLKVFSEITSNDKIRVKDNEGSVCLVEAPVQKGKGVFRIDRRLLLLPSGSKLRNALKSIIIFKYRLTD